MLQNLTDRTLVEKYALWLLQKDPDAGLKVREAIALASVRFSLFR